MCKQSEEILRQFSASSHFASDGAAFDVAKQLLSRLQICNQMRY